MVRARSVVVLGLLASRMAAQLPLPSTRTLTFGMVGLARGQVARLNVLNTGAGAAAACICELSFLDANAAILGSNSAQLAGGKAAYLDLEHSDVKGAPERVQIRGVVRTSPASAGPNQPGTPVLAAPCGIVPTLEILNQQSGRTTVVLTNAIEIMQLAPEQLPPQHAGR
jgi:hypothetical protein